MEKKRVEPFKELTQLIAEYEEKRLSFDIKDLIDIRERISLNLFYLSDPISSAISLYERRSYERKSHYSDTIIRLTGEKDSNGKSIGVTLASEMARVENKEHEKLEVEALRIKERARIVLDAAKQILNAISSRMSNIKPNY